MDISIHTNAINAPAIPITKNTNKIALRLSGSTMLFPPYFKCLLQHELSLVLFVFVKITVDRV